ncbi:hypothetical protein CIHG_01348 [Coccidioides immitis H538.4]|uniref:Uncharacterized protein n=1 Tax=Coccidioides immitis H538.4 TaxID=396776 RepID=A0A0J8REB6_COCIT|nr:hypothetical protein CIHG_01348 [Coccidioides immitis H538.4]
MNHGWAVPEEESPATYCIALEPAHVYLDRDQYMGRWPPSTFWRLDVRLLLEISCVSSDSQPTPLPIAPAKKLGTTIFPAQHPKRLTYDS